MQEFYYILSMSFLGLILGSFFAHLIMSRIFQKSPFHNRSECDSCSIKLNWYDNIPIYSYLMLRGKCRNCGAEISRGYLYIEITVFILFTIFSFLNVPSAGSNINYIALIITAIIFGMMVYNSIYDIYFFEIEDKIVIGGILLMLIVRILTLQNIFYLDGYLQAGIIGASVFGLTVILSKGRMGAGEIFYGLLMGLVLGLRGFYIAFMISIILAILGGTVMYLFTKNNSSEKIIFGKVMVPLVPFLSFGTVIGYFWGEKLFKIIFKI